MKKVLNLYAGIGGNRRLWKNVDVVAVEHVKRIAEIYQNEFPEDKVVHGDAHQYLLDCNFDDFDFIWASPPCPTHSQLSRSVNPQFGMRYPDMALYQEILILQHFFNGSYAVENVISYYDPLIEPQISNNHYFWTNFKIPNSEKDVRKIVDRGPEVIKFQEKRNKINLDKYHLKVAFKNKILNNCVKPEVGLEVFNAAFKYKQETLFD